MKKWMISMLMLMLLAIPAFADPLHDEGERLEYLGPLPDEASVLVAPTNDYARSKIYQMWSESAAFGGISQRAVQYDAAGPTESCTLFYVQFAIKKAGTYTIKIKADQGGTLAEDGWPDWPPPLIKIKKVYLDKGYWWASMHWHPATLGKVKYIAEIIKPGIGVISQKSTFLDVNPY